MNPDSKTNRFYAAMAVLRPIVQALDTMLVHPPEYIGDMKSLVSELSADFGLSAGDIMESAFDPAYADYAATLIS